MTLETQLRGRRAAGRKLLMPYVTGGITEDWIGYVGAFADVGADAIEVGLPFSDPTLDGSTIQRATEAALARGATARGILAGLARAPKIVPLVVSTYVNLIVRHGIAEFCEALRAAGVRGLIVPDAPLDEVDELAAAAEAAGVELALLAAPASPASRLDEIARRSRGFIYAVSVMGTTGERAALAVSAAALVARLKAATDRPVLLGFGLSTPEHAAQAGHVADGVVVGAALMRRVLDGASARDTAAFLATLRTALDKMEA